MEQPDDSLLGGLGFSATTTNGDNDDAAAGGGGDSNTMLKNLMQECLQYHHEQQQPHQQPQPHHQPVLPIHQQQQQQQQQAGFQSGGEERLNDQKKDGVIPGTIFVNHHNKHSLHAEEETSTTTTTTTSESPRRDRVEEGRLRANAILAKFQQLTKEHGGGGGVVDTTNMEDHNASNIASSEFRQKREKFLEKEGERKHKFLLKNLEYVGKRQTQRLQQTLSKLSQAQQYEHQIQDQYNAVLEHRKQTLNKNKSIHSEAGIGSAKRQRVEREKSQQGHAPPTTKQQQDVSLAIYLTGLPTTDDGSVAAEETLHQLFRSYGKIRKTHPYRNKQTGELKGDALVIYQVKPNQKEELLHTVCSQMNGAILPGGNVLKVQPADSNYQQDHPKTTSQYGPAAAIANSNSVGGVQQGATTTATTTNNGAAGFKDDQMEEGAATKEDEEEDEDLDDFFESLT